MFRLDVQTWCSDLMFRLDVQAWISCMGRKSWRLWYVCNTFASSSFWALQFPLSHQGNRFRPACSLVMAALIDEAMNTLGGKEWHYETRSKRLKTLGSPWLSRNFSHAAGLRRVWKARWCSWMCICPSSCPKALKPLLQPCNLNKWMTYLPLWNSKRGCHQEPKSVALWLNKRLAAWMSSNSSFSRLPWVQDRLRKLHLGLPTFRSSAQALGQSRRHFNPCSIECQGIMSNGT